MVVHAVLGSAGSGEDETLAADFHLFSERGVQGTLAQRIAVPSRNLVDKPAALSFAEAACLPTAYLTAYRMLFTRARLQPGQSVLVQGAGGGVATAAVLIGRAAGLAVYVTSRSEEKRDRAIALGAVGAVEPGGRLPVRVDAVLETVGTDDVGSLAEVAAPGGHRGRGGCDDRARSRRPTLRACSGGSSRSSAPRWARSCEFRRLCAFLEQTGVRPLVDSEHALGRCHMPPSRRLEAGDEFGKIVVLP